ncbi:MAG: winged helix-turn-helix domain-containing protein [bacterium]
MGRSEHKIAGYHCDDFILDVHNRQLLRSGKPLPLNSKYFEVLYLLIRHQGQLVEKQRIFDEVWQDVIVTDAALTQCIKDIRKQLGDDVAQPRYIKTVPKHGYVFIGKAMALEEANGVLAAPVTARSVARPYKFLDYFTEQDAALFFGREAEIEMMSSQVLAHRSFILHGRSGVGKSSLLRAGLLPRLHAQHHLVFVMRSFQNPLQQMATALREAVITELPSAHLFSVLELLQHGQQQAPQRGTVFLFDQFEEFFLLLAEEHRNEFIATIGALFLHENLPLHLVFAVREDRLAEMSQLKAAIPEIFHHEYRLQRLTREQATRAMTEPARAVGSHWEPKLVERVLVDLNEGGSIDPPQLQIVCDRLFDARGRSGELTVAAYEKLGTAAQILASYLERVLHHFNTNDLHDAREILSTLISADHQRLVLRVAELLARVRVRIQADARRISLLIEELATARVVRYRNQDGEGWLELAHDFLLPEITRWMTSETVALKRARGIITRAVENYRAHGLLIDADALQLLLPFGAQLGLTGEEADLLLTSLLNRGQRAPDWLVHTAPSSHGIVRLASQQKEVVVRLAAIEACGSLRHAEGKNLLRELALWDEELSVRRQASIALAEWLGDGTEKILQHEAEGEHAGLVRRAFSLALLRDHQRGWVKLKNHSGLTQILVLINLIGLRLQRGGKIIVAQGVGGMLGAGCAGVIGGLLLGVGLALARHTSILQGTSIIVVLVSLAVLVSALGGMGVSFGMLTIRHIAYRHSRWWSILGAAIGGALIGAIANQLGTDIFHALFGRDLEGITGAWEGASVGMGLSLGAVLTESLHERTRTWQRVVGAGLGAMCAGSVLAILHFNLFSGSLAIIARSFDNSQLSMDSLAAMFGEVQFGQTMQIIVSGSEGLLFGAAVKAGMEIAGRKNEKGNH